MVICQLFARGWLWVRMKLLKKLEYYSFNFQGKKFLNAKEASLDC